MNKVGQQFSSTTPVLSKNNNQNQVSFQGSFADNFARITDKTSRAMEFQGGTLNRMTFVSLAIIFLLGCRYMQARNADERREVATRDFSAVVTAVYAVPILKKIIGTSLEKKSGFAILDGEKQGAFKVFDRHLAEGHQIKEWYTFDKNSQDFVSFSKNLSDRGAKLGKVFSKEKEAKEVLCKLLNTNDISNKTNEEIITAIKNAENSEAVEKLKNVFKKETLNDILDAPDLAQRLADAKGKTKNVLKKFFGEGFINNVDKVKQLKESPEKLVEILKNGLSSEDIKKGKAILEKELVKENQALKEAKVLKSIPLSAGILFTAGFLGWFLPWFNIHYTRALYKSDKAKADNTTAPTPKSNPTQSPSSAQLVNKYLSMSQQELFAKFKNDKLN